MRRLALACCFTLFSVPAALAGQTQAPPPTPPPPPAPSTPPRVLSPGVPAPALPAPPAAQTPRPAAAQTPRPPTPQTAPRPGAAAPAPMPIPPGMQNIPGSWQNVKLDVTISDTLSADMQNKKTVSMLILDGRSGQVRSTGGEGLINIDARPAIRPDGRIHLQLTVEYRPELSAQQLQQSGTSRLTMFSESLALIVADGKPVVASQSSDPRSDRRVALEVTATVVK